MKSLLILPRLRPKKEIDYDYSFPIGIPYISAVMKKAGYNVDCLNLNHCSGTTEEVLEEKLKNNYDVVATGNIFVGFLVLKEIVDATRKFSPGSKIIIGGSVITSDPTAIDILKPDFAIIGEGEKAILKLLKNIPQNQEGGIDSSKERECANHSSEEFVDIDSLPYPDLDSFGFNEYLDHMYTNQWYYNNLFDKPRTYIILGSRGCPFQCTFCHHAIGRKYRKRSIDNIMEELDWAIKKYKINIVAVHDDCLALNKERLSEFCEKIKKFNIKWACQLIVKNMDKEILKKMKDSGCFVISYGFESMSLRVLKSMKKNITPKQIEFVFKATLEAGIAVQGNFIFGDKAETRETAKQTLDWWKENAKGQINLCFIQPYPGAGIYKHCLKKGIIEKNFGEKMIYISKICGGEVVLNMTEEMSDQEINELRAEILRIKVNLKFVGIPHYFKIMKDKYEIKVNCPFCKEEITYKNFRIIPNRYSELMICRECNYRFRVSSPPELINKYLDVR